MSALLAFILKSTALVAIIHGSFTLKSKINSSSRLMFFKLDKRKCHGDSKYTGKKKNNTAIRGNDNIC